MTRQMIQRDKLGELSKIGQGGQGVVYRAPNAKTKFADSMVYKEYKAATRAEIDFTTLAAMPALVEESLTYKEAERLVSIAAWPCAIIEDSGTPTGFVMPAIPDEFLVSLTTAKGVSSSTAEFQHLLNHPSVLVARGITLDDAQRCELLRDRFRAGIPAQTRRLRGRHLAEEPALLPGTTRSRLLHRLRRHAYQRRLGTTSGGNSRMERTRRRGTGQPSTPTRASWA